MQPPVGVEDLDVRRVAVVLEHDLVGLVLRQVGHAKIRDLRDQRLHLQLPLPVQLVPVLEVVAGPPLEELGPLGDLGGIRHRVPRDVDVAVDDAVVDAHGGRNGEDAVLPGGDAHVGDVRTDEVERGHRQREVHRVPEPEPLLVLLAPALVEERVVRVHLLPALAARRRLDLVRAGERSDRCRCRPRRDPTMDASRRTARCALRSSWR